MPTITDRTERTPMLPSLRDIATRVFRQRRVFVVCLLLVALGFVLTGQFSPKYQSEMKILVRKERVDSIVTPIQNSSAELMQPTISEEELNSQVELLKGDDLLRKVVVQAGLAPADDPVAVARALRRLQRNLDVNAITKTNVISVKYESGSPRTAKRVLADLGALYLAKHSQLHGGSYEISFFDNQVRQHESALSGAQAKLLAFTRKTGVVSASLERDLTIQQMESLGQQRLEAHASLADAEGTTSTLRDELGTTAPRIETASKHSDNAQLLEQLKASLLTFKLKRAELLAKYDSNYRLVKDADHEIAVIEQMIATQAKEPVVETTSDTNPTVIAIENELAHSQATLSGLSAKEADLDRSSHQLQRAAGQLEAQSIEQDTLMRAVKTEQDQYQLYVDKREQARMSEALDRQGILNVIVAQPPFTPALPVRSLPISIAFALFTGLILSLGAAFVFDILDPTVRSAAELEELLPAPMLEEFGREIYVQGDAA